MTRLQEVDGDGSEGGTDSESPCALSIAQSISAAMKEAAEATPPLEKRGEGCVEMCLFFFDERKDQKLVEQKKGTFVNCGDNFEGDGEDRLGIIGVSNGNIDEYDDFASVGCDE